MYQTIAHAPVTKVANDRPVLIDIAGVRQAYHKGDNDLLVLDDVSMTIREGEIVGLLGRSGSGKSSLLRIIAGLVPPSAGRVSWCGRPVAGPSEGLSMVFQSFALFPWLTVLQNVEIGLEAQGIPAAERRRRALEAIDLIGLDGFESAYPKELSGGMRQRVGFARALVVHPRLMLMDEPFSALDVLTAETLRTDLIDLWMEGRLPIKSILMVTHNIEEAILMCDRVLIFSAGPKSAGGFPGTGIGMELPHVSTNLMSGLMEALAAAPYNGRADLPDLAATLQMEADELFPIAETLQLLRFAELADGDIHLTEHGRLFAESDVDQRKRLFAAHLLAHVPIAALIRRVLDERPSHRAPRLRFSEELEDFMSEDRAEETLRAAVSWGRYAELFAYDGESSQFSLEDPV
jgi:NitT/TauT family transport system ATP-binding protein